MSGLRSVEIKTAFVTTWRDIEFERENCRDNRDRHRSENDAGLARGSRQPQQRGQAEGDDWRGKER